MAESLLLHNRQFRVRADTTLLLQHEHSLQHQSSHAALSQNAQTTADSTDKQTTTADSTTTNMNKDSVEQHDDDDDDDDDDAKRT